MFLISMRRATTSVASCCLLALPLACSAAGAPGNQISKEDSTGTAAAPGASGAAGAAPGAGGFKGHGVESPRENGGAPPVIVVQPGEANPTGCTKPQNILFLIDRSGSMQCNPPPITDSRACERLPATQDPTMPSKLQIVEMALSTAFNQLLPM